MAIDKIVQDTYIRLCNSYVPMRTLADAEDFIKGLKPVSFKEESGEGYLICEGYASKEIYPRIKKNLLKQKIIRTCDITENIFSEIVGKGTPKEYETICLKFDNTNVAINLHNPYFKQAI
jgi:hypothetical protein